MCQSSRLFPYVLVTKTKHIFFQVPQQLGSVYWRGWTNFWKNKTLHGSSFVYTGTAEPWKFLNGNVCKFLTWSEESQNWWPNGSTFTQALVNRAKFFHSLRVKSLEPSYAPLVSDVSRSADLRLWLQKELNISQKCCCSCCLQTPCRNSSWKFLWYFSINFLLSSSHFAFTVSQSTLSPSFSVYSPQGRGVATVRL